MAEGEKFLGYNQIPAIALDDVFILLDKSDTTQSIEGSTVWGTGQQLIDFVNKYANASVENTYATITELLAFQNQQGEGNIQRVVDASLDPTVNSGTAYYEYLGTTDADLEDYVKLTSAQVEAFLSPVSWKQKTIVDLDIEANVDADDASNGNVIFVYDGADVTHIIFDSAFTKVLEKARTEFSSKNFAINIFNTTQYTHLSAIITSFELINGNANLKVGVSGILTTAVAENHELQFDLPTELPDYLKLPVADYNDLYFDTSQNANPLVIEEGNLFKGHPLASKYVVGRVLDATDFDPYNLSKAKLFIDQE